MPNQSQVTCEPLILSLLLAFAQRCISKMNLIVKSVLSNKSKYHSLKQCLLSEIIKEAHKLRNRL